MAMERSDKILEQAAQWHARLSNEAATEADWLDFTAWLEADDAHRLAYDHIEDMMMDMAAMPEATTSEPPAQPAPATPANDDAALKGASVIDASARFGRRKMMITALTAVAALFLAVFGVGNFRGPDETVQTYTTNRGEQRQVKLADGTTVHLNTNSKLTVRFGEKARRTELAYGEALFSVAHNKKRPFYVNIGSDSVRVVGTVFNILRQQDAVKVTVARGIVEVSPTKADPSAKKVAPPVRLLPGLQFRRDEGHAAGAVSKVDPNTVTSWEHGLLDYDAARLIDVVDDLNRYYTTPIRVVGKARDERFSGVLKTTDQESALAVLAGGLDLKVERTDKEILLSPAD